MMLTAGSTLRDQVLVVLSMALNGCWRSLSIWCAANKAIFTE
ncbi:MAG: hypothetical protein VW258_14655 [Thalassolituus sp.]